MRPAFLRTLLRGCLLACALVSVGARADTPIKLFKPFAGNVNFTGTQKSMRTNPNGTNACSVNSGTQTMTLSGLPSGATVLSAHLYWAGSGATPDYSVFLDGTAVAAPLDRQYVVDTNSANNAYNNLFFAGAVDVTPQVTAKRNGGYTVGGLTIDSLSISNRSDDYCDNQTVLGGFQMLVVYSLPTENFRVLNIYEGFQYISQSQKTLLLSNFQIPNPMGSVTGRVGHITWEGDQTLADSEFLMFNDVKMFDATNPVSNQFNSGSNINNDSASYGIDFDAYTVSSPTIKGGQTEAYTTYKSGQDLVLMNVEIIAAPNVPATDRTVKMTLNNTMTPSQPSIYSIVVGNNGPLSETGPIKVTVALPSSLIYGGATGAGWTCNIAAQLLTCTYPGSLAMGGTLPVIALKVTPAASATGLISTSAKVTGALFDHDDSNNTATVSVRVGQSAFTPVYVFTTGPCVHGEPFGAPLQKCSRIEITSKVLANDDIRMHITYTVNDVPTSLATADITVKMKFALSCHDPGTDAGRAAKFYETGTAAISLALCAQRGLVPPASSSSWGSTFRDIVFTGNGASSSKTFTFNYADVGRIELLTIDQSGNLGSTAPFVSAPALLVLPPKVVNNVSRAANGAGASMPAVVSDAKFVPAGQSFELIVQAWSSGSPQVMTPNFGKEESPTKISVPAWVATDAAGTAFPEMTANLPDPSKPQVTLNGAFGPFAGGVASGAFSFDEVGIIRISVKAEDYLGTGDVSSNPTNIGRFYPHRFSTAVPSPPMACPKQLTCATDVAGAAYSKQAFEVQVTALNASGGVTRNYRDDFARDVVLGAYAAAQSDTANPPTIPSGSVLSLATGNASAFVDGVAVVKPVYTFADLAAGKFQSPTNIFIRAAETATVGDGVTSKITGGSEAGLLIVSGRMTVGNGYGSEKLPLPVRLQAEFFGGNSGWLVSATDNVSKFTDSDLVFTNCKKNFLSIPCKLKAQTAGNYTMVNGVVTTLKLAAPGAGNEGSAELSLANPLWLPSTKGRQTFGTYRAPHIYLREMY